MANVRPEIVLVLVFRTTSLPLVAVAERRSSRRGITGGTAFLQVGRGRTVEAPESKGAQFESHSCRNVEPV